jgi:hypothetical protein
VRATESPTGTDAAVADLVEREQAVYVQATEVPRVPVGATDDGEVPAEATGAGNGRRTTPAVENLVVELDPAQEFLPPRGEGRVRPPREVHLTLADGGVVVPALVRSRPAARL